MIIKPKNINHWREADHFIISFTINNEYKFIKINLN